MNESRKRMLDKVRAIMAKTMDNGCTESEAMTALEKARELMAAYDIAEHELGNTVEHESATIHKTDKNDPYMIKRWLAVPVGKFTRCKAWNGSSNGYGIGLCGLESDVIFADWLLDTLQRFVMRELKNHLAERRANGLKCPRIVSKSFVIGCAKRIGERLKELTPIEPVGKGLIVSRNALIEAAMKAVGIHLKASHSRRVNMDQGAFGAGSNAGNGARFDRPVSAGGNLMLR